jgi:threonine aldolase
VSQTWRGFASDNYAGIHPEVLSAIAAANDGHDVAYGDDRATAHLRELVRENFGPDAQVFPVFNGTGANVVALQAMTRSWEAVVCTDTAHIHVDEGGAPEKVAGLKLWTAPTADGLLTVEELDAQIYRMGDVHRAQPAALSVTQSSELGTAYTVEQLGSLVRRAHEHGLRVHVDGARLANAAASLGVSLRAITTDVGADAVSFGGTKNGAMGAEAVIVTNPELARDVPFVRKTDMQLASKMRFISAQLAALLTDELWLRNASHANAMAERLALGVGQINGVEVLRRVDANAVFAILPPAVTARLQERFRFYTWDEATGEVRWMCSWDTTESDVDAFVAAIDEEMSA